MEKHLLLPTSTPSKNFSLISEIYQSIIDLQWNPPENEIQTLLADSLSFLDKDLDIKTTEEIIYLIFECYSNIKNKKKEFLQEICENSKKNANRLILFASIISLNEKELNDDQIRNLISDISKQILKHIKLKNQKLIIFGHEISQTFKNNFIYNIISRIKTSDKVVSTFYSFILEQTNISKEKSDKLFQKAINANFITSFSEDVLADERYFDKFSKDNIISMLPKITAKTFDKLLKLIKKTFSEKDDWSPDFFNSIFEKCVEFDVDFKCNQIPFFFELFDQKTMKSSYWKYLSKNEVTFQDLFISDIDVITQCLLETNDTFMYKFIPEIDFDGKESKIIPEKKFWIHIFDVFSSSKEKYTEPLYKPFVIMFEQFVDIDNSYEYIEAMILSKFPTTETGNQFLIDFLNGLNSEYKEAFNQNRVILLTLISDLNVFPLPSFWNIFDNEFIEQNFGGEVEINDPVISYAYYFITCKSHSKTIGHFLIQPLTDESSAIEFIKKNDLNYMVNMNNDSLFLIIAALLYTEQEIKPEIYGLTKVTILPFLAISFNFLSMKNDDNYFPLSNEMQKLLIDACKYLVLADSTLMNESINSILVHFDFLLKNFNEIAFEMIEILFDQLNDDAYKADGTFLLKTIFEMQKMHSTNEDVQLFFEKFGINLIKCVLKIDDFYKLRNIKFDLKIFNIKTVSSILIESIQNTMHYNQVINAINIINNSNIKIQDIKIILKKIDLNKIFQKALFRKKIHDLTSLSVFCYRYKCSQSFVNQCFNTDINFLKSQNFTFQILYDFLISKSKSIVKKNYFEVFFEKICSDFVVKPKTILEKYSAEYDKYGDDFIKALLSNFVYNPIDEEFVKLPHVSRSEDDCKYFFLSVLFNEAESKSSTYETFSNLYNFISTFPFIFKGKNINNIFNAVLPALDNFDLYFTIENSDRENVNLLKRSLSAFYCLYASLYSPKVLDSFFPWLFKNIVDFTPTQAFSILYILISLFNTEKVKDGLLAYSARAKMGLTKILYQLSKMEVPPEIASYFNENIFQLTNMYFNEILNLESSRVAYFNGLKKNHSPFSSIFDHFHTIYPTQLSPLNLPKVRNNEIKEFIEYFNKPQNLSVHYDRPSIEITDEQVDEFISCCNKIYQRDEDDFTSKSYKVSYPNPKYIYNCSSRYDNWVFRSFFDSDFTLRKSSEHIQILNKAKNKIESYGSYDTSVSNCFSSDFRNYQFAFFMINDTKYSPIVSRIIKYSEGVSLFSEAIKRNCYFSDNYKAIKEYFIEIINDEDIRRSSKFNEALISFSLSPEMRKDIDFLIMTSKAISNSFHYSYPKNIDYFVSLVFSYNDENLNSNAFELIDKIDNLKILPSLEKSIKRFFDIEMAKSKPSILNIIKYVKVVPSLLKSCPEKIPLMIDTYLTYCKSLSSNKDSIIRVIYTLFNEISPERKEDEFIYNVNDEDAPIDFSLSMSSYPKKEEGKKEGLLQKVPDHVVKSNPTFWNLYVKHRDTLNEIVYEKPECFSKFKFLKDYPELMSFENRVELFRGSIKKVNENYSTDLYVSRSRILADSFNEMRGKSRNEWLRIFNVHFRNEYGIDAGGLTKDWFSLIAKEIFNEDFALFVLTENQTYQPNPFSGVNSQHIEYFNFIGKVIARALIQGQYVKCHFARSFIRQILRLPLKLRDFEDYDTNIYNSMLLILKEDVEPLCLTFTIDVDEFGVTKTVLLKEKGDEIDVTNENKKEYVSLYTNYKLRKSIIKQINAFCEGFYSLIPYKDIKVFSPSELDLLICGIPDIDVEDLRANTSFSGPYHNHHPIIEMFFSAISKWNREDLAKFLLFVTGSSQVPVKGFKEYAEKGKPFTISPGGEKERFCVAHTCFNTLDLPYYESEEELNRKLLISIQELEFGIA
ncbi:hypothetical protein M9Y10_029876 [Tritrichomonas musculus]|uniref:HECT-type E3 ubiquitin transferase n=1 Tax=Tritrichomonas musculus TaxID=1915356 RepID=A0ABR2KQE1_9EUKA